MWCRQSRVQHLHSPGCPRRVKTQAGLVNVVHSVVSGRVESRSIFLIYHKNSLKHTGTTLWSYNSWNCSKTKQPQNHDVYSISHMAQSFTIFCSTIASVSLHFHATSGFYHQVTKLGKIVGVLQRCCHLCSSLSSKLGFKWTQKASKSILKVTRFVKIQTFRKLSHKFQTCFTCT